MLFTGGKSRGGGHTHCRRVLRRFECLEKRMPRFSVLKEALAAIYFAAVLSSFAQQPRANQPTLLGRAFSGGLSGPLAIHAGASLAGKDSIDASSTVSSSWDAFCDSGTDARATVLRISPFLAGLLMSIPLDNRNV